MSAFGGLWKHENNQRELVPPKKECAQVAEELKMVTYTTHPMEEHIIFFLKCTNIQPPVSRPSIEPPHLPIERTMHDGVAQRGGLEGQLGQTGGVHLAQLEALLLDAVQPPRVPLLQVLEGRGERLVGAVQPVLDLRRDALGQPCNDVRL